MADLADFGRHITSPIRILVRVVAEFADNNSLIVTFFFLAIRLQESPRTAV